MEKYFLLTVLLMGSFGCSKSSNTSENSQVQKISNIEISGIGIMTFNTKWLLAGAEQAQRLKGKGIWGLEDKDEDHGLRRVAILQAPLHVGQRDQRNQQVYH